MKYYVLNPDDSMTLKSYSMPWKPHYFIGGSYIGSRARVTMHDGDKTADIREAHNEKLTYTLLNRARGVVVPRAGWVLGYYLHQKGA